MKDSLHWQGERITVRRSRRKTLALHVREGEVELRVPSRARPADLLTFLDSRAGWLERVRADQARRLAERPDFSQADACPLLDRSLPLSIRPSSRNRWRLSEAGLDLAVRAPDREGVHAVLADFYKAQARFHLTEKTLQLVHRHGWESRLSDIRLRRTRSKWGHCTSAGRIQYNWLVILAPEKVVDYLVAHETAHLLHPHHGPAFWAEVERLHPSWRTERHWLRDQGHRLQL